MLSHKLNWRTTSWEYHRLSIWGITENNLQNKHVLQTCWCQTHNIWLRTRCLLQKNFQRILLSFHMDTEFSFSSTFRRGLCNQAFKGSLAFHSHNAFQSSVNKHGGPTADAEDILNILICCLDFCKTSVLKNWSQWHTMKVLFARLVYLPQYEM